MNNNAHWTNYYVDRIKIRKFIYQKVWVREREKSWLLRIDDQVQKSLKLSMLLFICGAYSPKKKINLTFITFCVCKEALLIWKGIHHESLLLYASHISPHICMYDVSDTICRCWCAMELISFLHSRFLLFSIIIKRAFSSSQKVHQSKSLLTDPHSRRLMYFLPQL